MAWFLSISKENFAHLWNAYYCAFAARHNELIALMVNMMEAGYNGI